MYFTNVLCPMDGISSRMSRTRGLLYVYSEMLLDLTPVLIQTHYFYGMIKMSYMLIFLNLTSFGINLERFDRLLERQKSVPQDGWDAKTYFMNALCNKFEI